MGVIIRVENLLAERDHVLLAFGGPIAELATARSTAGRLRLMMTDVPLPRKVARTDDPFVVLDHAKTIGPATERAVYQQLCRIEHEMVAVAPIVPGIREALATMASGGTQVTVVSSLAAEAVRAFLVMHGLVEHVRALSARASSDGTLLPPAPYLIAAAIHARTIPVESCLFVGSTAADLKAARAAGVDTIRYRRQARSPSTEPVVLPPPARPWLDALSASARS